MQFRLKFINSVEQEVRELEIEADDHEAAISYSSSQSVCFDMPVELWRADELVIRITPMTARLHLLDDTIPHLSP